MVSSSKNSGTNSFELQVKADEWIDVTPTEEVLRAELARLQEAFEKCTTQLDSSRLENDLLKDRSEALEHEAKDLQSILERTNTNLTSTQQELAGARKTAEEERMSLETKLKIVTDKQVRAEQDSKALEKQLSDAHKQRLSDASLQKTAKERLERELKSSKVETKTHKDAAIRFAEDLRIFRENHRETKKALAESKKSLLMEKELHSKIKKTLGTVATLAETLKFENEKLKLSLTKEQSSRTTAESKSTLLAKEMADLRALHVQKKNSLESELAQRLKDLNGSNESLQNLQIEMKSTEKELREYAIESASVKAHLAGMEQGRHELLERQSELEESLEEALDDLTMQTEECASAKDLLEKAILERDTLRKQRSVYLQSSEREAELEAKLLDQKKAFEKRLKDIHSILGLKFTTACQTEVRTIRKNAIKQMPKSFKVPLLQYHEQEQSFHQRHHLQQRQQDVKSS
mmetsp:Transcript_19591/g.48781  ORF Transcript_19591/g.48781 Transcript_19591/m.48781 type:complete len:463 (-) Transcript_19591:269-1657(-)|eukprot:CAMPEP_0116093604 /NCGR_PEP_ID=MMETSP0327-20121206/8686_1 /TAXON_ID=44447 /ORGANISM="Pseudo-nitzschia delicatissima, Strain B596" /LENGTH=462 /DNA_ID=CAMNT_0003585151 /DNA_START=186 /DNA_END=1574 /DNA_ORIENTATION=+